MKLNNPMGISLLKGNKIIGYIEDLVSTMCDENDNFVVEREVFTLEKYTLEKKIKTLSKSLEIETTVCQSHYEESKVLRCRLKNLYKELDIQKEKIKTLEMKNKKLYDFKTRKLKELKKSIKVRNKESKKKVQ